MVVGEVCGATENIVEGIHPIVKNLYDALKVSLDPIIDDPLFQPMVIFLDTETYNVMDCNDVMEQVKIIVHRFKSLLL